MSLTGKTIANSYKDLLQVNNSNSGIDTTARSIVDGEGTTSALSLSDDALGIRPQNDDTSSLLSVRSLAGTQLLIADSTLLVVKSLGHILNTQYKTFRTLQLSAVAETWYALEFDGGIMPNIGDTLGTGEFPATTFTATVLSLNYYWYVHDNKFDDFPHFELLDVPGNDKTQG